MTKYLIFILGLFALFLLHGCTTVSETKPQPAPEPEARAPAAPPGVIPQPGPQTQPLIKSPKVIPQPAVTAPRTVDTGVEWVTDVSDLKSRHRFQLAGHTIEINPTTRYYGGTAADIGVRARLRAVGVSRDGVIAASAVYFERSVQPAPVQAAAASKAVKPTAPSPPARTRSASAPPPGGLGTVENAIAKPVVPERAAHSEPEKTQAAMGSARPSPGAATNENAKTTTPPAVTASPARPSTPPSATEAVKAPPAAEAHAAQSKLAKAEPRLSPPRPGAAVPENETVPTPSAGATPTKDFSHLVFNEQTLPMPLDHGWTLDRQRDLVDGASRCVLLSPAFTIFDGYYPAKMWLRINPIHTWVKTDSNIDTSYPEQGLRVDNGSLTPFAKQLADAQTVYTDVPVLHDLSQAHTLTVALGFWPTWPKTKTQTASVDLAGFANASAALQACSRQTQAARE